MSKKQKKRIKELETTVGRLIDYVNDTVVPRVNMDTEFLNTVALGLDDIEEAIVGLQATDEARRSLDDITTETLVLGSEVMVQHDEKLDALWDLVASHDDYIVEGLVNALLGE